MMALKTVFTREELLADDDFARPQIEAGYRLHGGFDAAGKYVSPRVKHRWPAIRNWAQQLETRGFPLIDATTGLLKRGNYPTAEQQRFLLTQGFGQSLWNGLTVTGVIEARGRVLCDVTAPDFQAAILDDLSGTCTGHLNEGLLYAHGLDEGGDKPNGVGGHDDMWFAVRDALFGKNAYPDPVIPESLARPEAGRRMPQIAKEIEDWILLLMNVLMIEVRAESFFSFCIAVMTAPDTFLDRKEAALHAAEIVDRIRTDEAVHVGYLQCFVSELRSFRFRTADGSVDGASLIDPAWRDMIAWHAETNADFGREQARKTIRDNLIAWRPDGQAIFDRFETLASAKVAAE